jgi:hypothetical protein
VIVGIFGCGFAAPVQATGLCPENEEICAEPYFAGTKLE